MAVVKEKYEEERSTEQSRGDPPRSQIVLKRRFSHRVFSDFGRWELERERKEETEENGNCLSCVPLARPPRFLQSDILPAAAAVGRRRKAKMGGGEVAAAKCRVSVRGRKTEPHLWTVSSNRFRFHVEIAIPPVTDRIWTPCDSREMPFGIRPRRRYEEMSRADERAPAPAHLSSLCLMHAESKEGIGKKKKRLHSRTSYTNKRNIAVVARQSDCTVYRLPTMSPPLPTRREREIADEGEIFHLHTNTPTHPTLDMYDDRR